MMTLPDSLTQDPDGFIHVTGHRIGLQHLVHYYNEGYSAEMLACEYIQHFLWLPSTKSLGFTWKRRLTWTHTLATAVSKVSAAPCREAGPGVVELRQRLQNRPPMSREPT